MATMFGKWDESMFYVNGEYLGKGKGTDALSTHCLWKRSKPPQFPTRYNLTRFAIKLNELTPGLKVNPAAASLSLKFLFSVSDFNILCWLVAGDIATHRFKAKAGPKIPRKWGV